MYTVTGSEAGPLRDRRVSAVIKGKNFSFRIGTYRARPNKLPARRKAVPATKDTGGDRSASALPSDDCTQQHCRPVLDHNGFISGKQAGLDRLGSIPSNFLTHEPCLIFPYEESPSTASAFNFTTHDFAFTYLQPTSSLAASLALTPPGFASLTAAVQLSPALLGVIKDLSLVSTAMALHLLAINPTAAGPSCSLTLLTLATQATYDLTSLLLVGRHTLTTLEELVALGLAAYAEHVCHSINAPVAMLAACPQQISYLALAAKPDLAIDLAGMEMLHGAREAVMWVAGMLVATRAKESPGGVLGRRLHSILEEPKHPQRMQSHGESWGQTTEASTSAGSACSGEMENSMTAILRVCADSFFWDGMLTDSFLGRW